jgi:hypothetical protein
MNNLISRRSLKAPHLARLPSKSLKGEKDLTASCPNSPAIKKALVLFVSVANFVDHFTF